VKIGVDRWQNLFGAIIAGLIVAGFCFLLVWHDPLVFWNDDYELSILPVFSDVARSWSEGHLPLLSPYSWVCNNLAGEFQYGTFSVFVNAAVVLIWKFPLTFPQQASALSITHLFVLALGAFLLARDRRLSTSLSMFVALVTTLNGWIICWGATDWFGALGAFTWLPWAWFGLERSLDRQRTRWRFLWPAPFVYLLVTGGFPYTVLMLVVLIGWLACRAVASREGEPVKTTLPMLFGAALGFGMSAPAWLAILDHVSGSARSLQSAGAHWQWIVPWRALPGFILPCWTVNWADFSTHYLPHGATELTCGLVAPAALVAGFLWRPWLVLRRLKWELILLVVLLALCLAPMAGFFRWSFRWLPFFHFVLALCAAHVLQLRARLAVGSTAFLLLIVVTIPMSLLNTGGAEGAALTWVYFEVAAVWALFELFLPLAKIREWAPPCATFVILLATYIYISPNCGVPKYNLSQDLLKPAPLDQQRLYLSIYPPPETDYRVEKKPHPVGQLVRPGSTSMWAGVRLINGYSPILPAGVARNLDFRVHGEINLHEAEYLVWFQSDRNGLLAQLGVDGIVVAWDADIDPALGVDWEFVNSTAEGAVYHRIGAPLAHVCSVTSIDSQPNAQFVSATISKIDDTRNRVSADVDVPRGGPTALLTFSRPFFPGYEARIDGQRLNVDSYRSLFPIVEVPSGTHGRLTMVYRPWWLIWGSAASILCVGVWLFGILSALRTRIPNASN
jgi:hypothetical protein